MSIPKRRLFASFWDLPPPDSPPGHINPKTILNNAIPAPLWPFREVCVALPDPVSPLPFPASLLPVFPTCNVRMKFGLPCTFSSGRVTSGNCQPAFQAHLWHFPVFRTCNVRKKIGLPRTFSSGRVTSGTAQRAFLCSYSSCSKSFGESTPHRDACRAHSSPNSPISPRLVKPPPPEGPVGHVVHQTIWHKDSNR